VLRIIDRCFVVRSGEPERGVGRALEVRFGAALADYERLQ